MSENKAVVEVPKGYLTWQDDRGRALALGAFQKAIEKVRPVLRATASDIWLNSGTPGVGARDGFDRRDYDAMRTEERLPVKSKDIIRACMQAYDETGIIRNVTDLQADLAVMGLDLEHPSDRTERFYKEWFRRVNGLERSVAFVKQALVTANVIVRRHTARLSDKDIVRLKRSQSVSNQMVLASPDMDPPSDPLPLAREIPLRYTFLNPLTVDLADEAVATFVGPESFRFFVRIPEGIRRRVKNPARGDDQALVQSLPGDIVSAIRRGDTILSLDPDKVSAFYLKRDDWQPWAIPALRAILPDLQILKKMKLADIAALDGAISSIRVWKVGSLEHRIIPPESVLLRLAKMLTQNIGGGVMDLVWGPDIDLLQTNTDVHKFLGDNKYAPCLNFIFQGLGIPSTLNGTGQGGQQGYTNSSISMRTFTERLNSVRGLLRQFWEGEIRRVQIAMGHARPASVVFDNLFTDQASERKLYIDLYDRDIISLEAVQEAFGLSPEIERVRMRKQMRARDKGKIPLKAGPFHDANYEAGIMKILAQTGDYSASELGLELDERKSGDEPPAERRAKVTKKYAPKPIPTSPDGPDGGPIDQAKPKGQPGQGRPQNSKDSRKRKQKVVKPRGSSAFIQGLARAEQQLADISRVTAPLYLKSLGKKTARELTEAESESFERFKFDVLCQFDLTDEISEQVIGEVLREPLRVPTPVLRLLETARSEHVTHHERAPAIETVRRYQAASYTLWRTDCLPEHLSESVRDDTRGVSTENPKETESTCG